jgi:hypothetical protein
MTIGADPRPRRRRAIRKVLVALAIVAGMTALVMSAFQVGMTTGLGATGGALIVYAVPATIFDWPRLTWEDVLSTIGTILSAIGNFVSALFDW